MKKISFPLFLSIICIQLFSQTCAVTAESLKGQYTGNCKNGRADGKGTAIGTDTYTGEFKKGLPDGKGKYTWKNGDWYEGYWKAGLFNGEGTLTKLQTSTDSSVSMTGFWKNGKYTGKYEKPYTVQALTNNISDINTRKLNSTDAEISINIKSITGGASSINDPVLPKARIISIDQVEGRFEQQVTDENSSKFVNKYVFKQVTFPFNAVFSLESTGTKLQVEKMRVEILEPGSWYIQVQIDN